MNFVILTPDSSKRIQLTIEDVTPEAVILTPNPSKENQLTIEDATPEAHIEESKHKLCVSKKYRRLLDSFFFGPHIHHLTSLLLPFSNDIIKIKKIYDCGKS